MGEGGGERQPRGAASAARVLSVVVTVVSDGGGGGGAVAGSEDSRVLLWDGRLSSPPGPQSAAARGISPAWSSVYALGCHGESVWSLLLSW